MARHRIAGIKVGKNDPASIIACSGFEDISLTWVSIATNQYKKCPAMDALIETKRLTQVQVLEMVMVFLPSSRVSLLTIKGEKIPSKK